MEHVETMYPEQLRLVADRLRRMNEGGDERDDDPVELNDATDPSVAIGFAVRSECTGEWEFAVVPDAAETMSEERLDEIAALIEHLDAANDGRLALGVCLPDEIELQANIDPGIRYGSLVDEIGGAYGWRPPASSSGHCTVAAP